MYVSTLLAAAILDAELLADSPAAALGLIKAQYPQ